VPAFWVKLGANDLNCVDVPLNPTHSLTIPDAEMSVRLCCMVSSLETKKKCCTGKEYGGFQKVLVV